MVVIRSTQRAEILDAVRAMYTAVATHPTADFHFPIGRAACDLVGYPPELLDQLPPAAVESFAGVGYPFAAGAVRGGDTVLDVGSGSGTDALIASRLVGEEGVVFALDMTRAMQEKLERVALEAGAANVRPLAGNAEEIPLPNECVDAVTSNGVLNLVPDKPRAIAEIFRVLRPGGRVQIADIALGAPAPEACRSDPELWAECIVGATLESGYLQLLRAAGFRDVEVLTRLDYFAASRNPQTRRVAESLRAHSLVLRAARPDPGTSRVPTASHQ